MVTANYLFADALFCGYGVFAPWPELKYIAGARSFRSVSEIGSDQNKHTQSNQFDRLIFGIKIMIVRMIVNTLVSYYLNSFWSGRFICYSFKQQVADILPSFGLALVMATGVFALRQVLPFNILWILITQTFAGAGFIFLFCEATKFKYYFFMKELHIKKIGEIRKKKSNG